MKIFQIIFLLFPGICLAQEISAGFTAPDNVCLDQTFAVQNTSTGPADTYYWEICTGAPVSASLALDLGNPGGTLNGCSFYSLNEEAGTYYMFVCSNFSGNLARLSFGNSLMNIPTAVNLGNFSGLFPSAPEGIQIEKEGSNWYGIVIGSSPGKVCLLNFGSSLLNSPTVVNYGNIGNLSYPHSLNVFHSGANKYALITNYSSSTLTRLDFGTSFSNTPTGINLGNIGNLNNPTQMTIVNSQGNWHGFIHNYTNNTISRLDFGSTLLGIPTGTNMGNPNSMLNGPRGLNVSVECDNIKGWAGNRGNNLLMSMSFPNGITGTINLTSLGTPGNLVDPHSMARFREGNNSILFIVDGNDHRLSRISYSGCGTMPTYTIQNISSLSFSIAGTYTIKLTVNEGKYNQAVSCKTITVGDCASIPIRHVMQGISVFPNPSAGVYVLKSEFEIRTQVFNVVGNLMFENNYPAGDHQINLSDFEGGIYILKISSGEKAGSIKLLKTE